MSSPQADRLLQNVRRRLSVGSVARATYWSLIGLGGIYAVLLLVSRLSAAIPDWFDSRSIVLVPALALLIGFALHRRPTATDAARRIDAACRTKDLYLTAALLEKSPGEFKPLVLRDAEARSSSIRPVDVVPLGWSRRFADVGIVVAVLLVGVFFLPRLDPFGKIEAAQTVADQKNELEKSRQMTTVRVAEVKREQKEASEAKEVKKAVDNLQSAFKKMQPNSQKKNFDVLAGVQKAIGDKYRKLSTDRLREFLSEKPMSQEFGGSNPEQLRKWTKDLQRGSTDSLSKELEEIKVDLQKLMRSTDPVEKAKLAQKARKRLQELSDFAGRKANSNELNAALKRAMEQLEMAKKEGLSDQALQAAAESLDLSKMELEQLAQSIDDLKKLEEALKTIQMAKQANDKQSLDGQQCDKCQSLEDYAELYAKMGGDKGQGKGMKGPGRGEGGKAPEDKSSKTAFKDEQSKTAVTAGKTLLTLKTKGLGEKGDAKVEYREAIRKVRQGASEAILTEQIPPGYHDGIKKYFDTITDSSDDAPSEGAAETNPDN